MVGNRLSLRQTLGAVSFVDCGDIEVRGLCSDSRNVQSGDLFVALSGSRLDGHDCAAAAVRAGATGILVERPISGIGVPQCVVRDSRAAWARLCMAWHHVPMSQICVAGVTGTNGKTTSTWLLRSILQAAGHQTGLLGTIEYSDGRHIQPAALTTPDAADMATLFGRMTSHSTTHCVMEVSSHAIDQRRCSGVPLSVAAITNITHDHFDYHGTVDHYRRTKACIAGLLQSGCPLLIGTDDAGCRAILQDLPAGVPLITFGLQPDAQIQGSLLERQGTWMRLQLKLQQATVVVRTSLAGNHNILNCLVAAAMAEQLGVHPDQIVLGLERVVCVPGRMERIVADQPYQVFVDYAHTPDGLRHCLQTVRDLTTGRVVLVFGAGGDRDRKKRPLMAGAAQAADVIFVTSDNPRSEPPEQIIQEILEGFDDHGAVTAVTDRANAIRQALDLARPDDVVVVAGRGHESVQQIGPRQICFDDRRVVRRLLRDQAGRQRDFRAGPAGGGRAMVQDQIPA